MAKPRPLSPHLQIYRLPMPALMSIAHRATGVILATGTIILAVWLMALAHGPQSFAFVAEILRHPLGQFVLFGYSVALFYHAFNGIRHLGWDIGFGLGIPDVYRSGFAVLVATIVTAVVFWFSVWF